MTRRWVVIAASVLLAPVLAVAGIVSRVSAVNLVVLGVLGWFVGGQARQVHPLVIVPLLMAPMVALSQWAASVESFHPDAMWRGVTAWAIGLTVALLAGAYLARRGWVTGAALVGGALALAATNLAVIIHLLPVAAGDESTLSASDAGWWWLSGITGLDLGASVGTSFTVADVVEECGVLTGFGAFAIAFVINACRRAASPAERLPDASTHALT